MLTPLFTGKLGELVGIAECVGVAVGGIVGGPIGRRLGVLLGYEDGAGNRGHQSDSSLTHSLRPDKYMPSHDPIPEVLFLPKFLSLSARTALSRKYIELWLFSIHVPDIDKVPVSPIMTAQP